MHKCWECGRDMHECSMEHEADIKGEIFTFISPGVICDCGWSSISPSQMREYDIKLADAYRMKYELLTTNQILTIRKMMGMSQQKFADFLGVHAQSIKRWENGLIQDKAMDNLIRLKLKEYYGTGGIPEIVIIEDVEIFKEINVNMVADHIVRFCIECGDYLSNMKLQKYVYYVQGWFLGFYGIPLFKDRIEAWTYGPVQPDLYKRFKKYGSCSICDEREINDSDNLPEAIKKYLESIIFSYSKYSPAELVRMTHNEPPWKETTQGDIINQSKMQEYFSGRLKQVL